jgi:hypothetical protein
MSIDDTRRAIGDELDTLRTPLAWILLVLAGILLVAPAVLLGVHAVDWGLDMIETAALATANVSTGFPFVLLPLAAVLLARGTAGIEPVRRVAATAYAVGLALGVVSLVLVSTSGDHLTFGSDTGPALGVYVVTQLAQLGVVAVALVVSLRLGRPQPQ